MVAGDVATSRSGIAVTATGRAFHITHICGAPLPGTTTLTRNGVTADLLVRYSSSSPFPIRWGQRPEFLISRMLCPGHPPG